MSSRLPRDGALEKGDKTDEKKKNKKIHPPVPHLLQAAVLPYANVVGCPDTESYPATSADPSTKP